MRPEREFYICPICFQVCESKRACNLHIMVTAWLYAIQENREMSAVNQSLTNSGTLSPGLHGGIWKPWVGSTANKTTIHNVLDKSGSKEK